jgi:hypothetical protein
VRKTSPPARSDPSSVSNVNKRQGASTPKRPFLQTGTANGVAYLRAVFPADINAALQTVDLSFLLTCPNLWEPFSSGFIACQSVNRPATRRSSARYLCVGFIAFLEHIKSVYFTLSDLSTTLANQFINWLDRVEPQTGTAVWSPATRSCYCSAFNSLICWLQQQRQWQGSLPKNLALPSLRWLGLTRSHRPTPILSQEQLLKVYLACKAEITTINKQITDLPELLQSASGRIPQSPTTYSDYPDLAVCLAALLAYFPDSIPNEKEVCQHNFYLQLALRKQGGLLAVRRYLFPDVRGMVPFVLLLAIHTCFNPEALLASSIDDYSIEQRLGQDIFVARVFKWRSRRAQLVTKPADAALDNPASLVKLLLCWSERARRMARVDINRRLFLFVPSTGHFNITTFRGVSVWRDNLHMFCDEHNIPRFSLKQIRHTMIDVGITLYRGDIRAAQALGNQRSPQTLFEHYTSDAQRQRNAERTGEIMSLRRRWRETGGLIDPRDQPDFIDQGAATPGWRCFDPYDSPFAMKGKPCDAYGMCPICPLAHLDFTSAYACAQLHNLLGSIRKARERMAPEAFLARFGPVEIKMQVWLGRFPRRLHEEAKQFEHLRPLPVPE